MTAFIRTLDPASEPVTLNEAKAHLRVTGSNEDDLIGNLITVARMACEEYTRRALVTQEWTLWMDRFPESNLEWWDGLREGVDRLTTKRFINLPRAPLQSVTTVATYDDNQTVFASSLYFVDTASAPGRLALRNNASWPVPARRHHGISIHYVSGYGASADVPQALKQGMLAHIAHYYEQRGDGFSLAGHVHALKALPELVTGLYQPYRIQHLLIP